VIIDCHGHYTTAPQSHTDWRTAQVAAFDAGTAAPAYPSISDDESCGCCANAAPT
jgi:4-oxalmesaconate hydratase